MSRTPEIPPWLTDALARTQQVQEALHRSIVVQIPPYAIANAALALEQYHAARPSLLRALENIQTNLRVVEGIEQLWRDPTPENWHELGSGEQREVISLIEKSGISVVWPHARRSSKR